MKLQYIVLLLVVPILQCTDLVTAAYVKDTINSELVNKISQETSDKSVKIIHEKFHFPNKQLIHDWHSLEDERLVYLVCDKESHSCKIRQTEYPYADATHSCDIKLDIDKTVQRPHVLVIPFGESKIILISEYNKNNKDTGTSVRISIVHLNGCTKTKDFILSDPHCLIRDHPDCIFNQLNGQRKIITYNDTFEIFFKDKKRCGDNECKLTMNDDGKAVMKPVEFISNRGYDVIEIDSIAAHSSAKGYAFTKYKSFSNNAGRFLMMTNRSEQQLQVIGNLAQLSVINETIGICSKELFDDPNITCSQYNALGEFKFNFTYETIVRPYSNTSDIHLHFSNVYTLPEEGFLLQIFEYIKCQDYSVCEMPAILNYYIVKVDTTGKEVGRFSFGDYEDEYEIDEARMFWKSKNTEGYCALMLKNQRVQGRFDLITACFENTMFLT